MKKSDERTLSFGDLVAATFDQALKVTRDPKRAAALAALVVQRSLRRRDNQQLVARLTEA